MQGKKTLAGQVNTKTASITDFKIDKENPTIDVSYSLANGLAYIPGTWANQNVIIRFSLSDNGGSGVSGSEQFNNISVRWMADHTYVTEFYGKSDYAYVMCFDGAGNVKVVNLNVWVDPIPPNVPEDSVLEMVFNKGTTEWASGSLRAQRGAISDSLSGLASETINLTNARIVNKSSNSLGSAKTSSRYDLGGELESDSSSYNFGALDSGQDFINVSWILTDVARKYSRCD